MRFQNEILTTESHALQRNHKQELEKTEKILLCVSLFYTQMQLSKICF